jgi:hypothetical protein
MEIFRELYDDSKSEHWQDGLVWFAWSLIGGLLPVWLTIGVLLFTRQQVLLRLFTDNGEFALYSASYIAGTLYILFKDFSDLRKRSFPSRSVLGLTFTVLLLASASMFMVVCLINVIGATWKPEIRDLLDKDLLRQTSLFVFPISMILSLLVVVAENIRTTPPVSDMANSELEKLGSDLDKLVGGGQ